MATIAESQRSTTPRIDKIEVSTDKLTNIAGLTPFMLHLGSINVFPNLKIFPSNQEEPSVIILGVNTMVWTTTLQISVRQYSLLAKR